MAGLYTLVIGQWRVYTFFHEITANPTYRGSPSTFTLPLCFAQLGNVKWELLQAISGHTIFTIFFDMQGECMSIWSWIYTIFRGKREYMSVRGWGSMGACGVQVGCGPGVGDVRDRGTYYYYI